MTLSQEDTMALVLKTVLRTEQNSFLDSDPDPNSEQDTIGLITVVELQEKTVESPSMTCKALSDWNTVQIETLLQSHDSTAQVPVAIPFWGMLEIAVSCDTLKTALSFLEQTEKTHPSTTIATMGVLNTQLQLAVEIPLKKSSS